MAIKFENVYTPEDLFKYVILREDYTPKQTLHLANELLLRIPSNALFSGVWKAYYEIVKISSKYRIPLGYDQLQQIATNSIDNLLKMGIDRALNVTDDKLSDIEKRDIILNTLLETFEDLTDSEVEDYDDNLLSSNMELYIQTWADDAYETMLNNELTILQGEAKIGKVTYHGAEGAGSYHDKTSAFIKSILDKDAGELSESIDTSLESVVDIRRKMKDEDLGKEVAKTGIEEFDKHVSPFKKGEILVIQGGSGTGKSIPNSTIIPTPNGFKTVGEVKKGDLLFDRKGKPTTVMGVFPQGLYEAYEVTLSDGRKFTASPDHLVPYIGAKGKIVNKELKDMLIDYKIEDGLNVKYNYTLPTNDAVNYTESKHDVAPYALGVSIVEGKINSIDDSYLMDSINNREDLLKGLYSFDQFIYASNTKLKDDILQLIYSLGYGATEDFKDDIYKIKVLKHEDVKLNIIDIKPVAKTEMTCFLVDNPEHLFLINDYIATHNTRFAVNIVHNGMVNYGSNVLYISLEQKSTAIYPMVLAKHIFDKEPMLANMTDKDIREGTYNTQDAQFLEQAEYDLVDNKDVGRIRIEGKSVGADDLKAFMTDVWEKGFHFDIIVLDYIGLVEVKTNRYDDVTATINMLKSECKTFKGQGFLGVIPNQLSKQAEESLIKGDTDTAKLGGAESQAIVRAADYVLTLAQTPDQKKNNLMTLITSKIRLGNQVDDIELQVNLGKMYFASVDLEDEDDDY